MKTLIITGLYMVFQGSHIEYNVAMFGQTPASPKCECFRHKTFKARNYTDFIEQAKAEYCKYFEVDGFNIVTIDVINDATMAMYAFEAMRITDQNSLTDDR
jgi:hypothetical protein